MTRENTQIDKKDAEKLLRRVTTASVTIAIVLIAIKTWGYIESGSVAILGTLLDSVMDALASLIIFGAVRVAMVPADEDHRFGHGKAEAIAGLLQAFVISMTSFVLLYESIDKVLNPQIIERVNLGISIIIVSMILTFILVLYQRYVARITTSVAIEADGLHYTGDIILNLGVVISLVLGGYFNMTYADPFFGGIACFYLLYNAYRIFQASTDMLMDKEMSDEDRTQIERAVCGHSRVSGIHELRTRRSGLDIFIQFHMELEKDISLYDAHIISDQVKQKIIGFYPNAEVFIHTDPYNDGQGKI